MNEAMNKRKMMRRLQSLDFALIEATLFLDGQPNNQKALSYFNKMQAERKQVAEEYQKAFGPLTSFANASDTEWQWVKGPWPWELED